MPLKLEPASSFFLEDFKHKIAQVVAVVAISFFRARSVYLIIFCVARRRLPQQPRGLIQVTQLFLVMFEVALLERKLLDGRENALDACGNL